MKLETPNQRRDSGPRARGRLRASGFTIIELLVVIGIILVLVGLFFAGAKIVTAQAKERNTRQTLEICKTMFENYKQATKLSRYPVGLSFGPNAVPVTPTTWYTAQEKPVYPVGSSPTWMGSTNPDTLWPPPSPKVLTTSFAQEILDSGYVFSALESIPENQSAIANIPSNNKVNVTLPNNVSVAWPLDAWGNLILFVPGGGLGVYGATSGVSTNGMVWLDSVNYGIITSTGPVIAPTAASTYNPSANPNSNQPFFVSGGPDGDVSNVHGNTSLTDVRGNQRSDMTDDNVYSFQ